MNRILLLFGFFLSFLVTSIANTPTEVACSTPEGLFASSRDSIAVLNWKSMGSNNGYIVEWKLRRDTVWKSSTVTTNMLLIKNLTPCSEYEFRVKSLCGLGEMSTYSESAKFKTIGCVAPCGTPREVGFETGDNSAFFKWTNTGARAYEIQFKDATNDGAWRTEIVSLPVFSAANLKPCNKYFFRVRSICGNTSGVLYSEWSSTVTVATTGCQVRCVAPTRISYTVTNAAVVIKWDSTAGASYDLQLKGQNDSLWRTISGIRKPFYELTNLAACTQYQARVKVNCSNNTSSDWSYIIRFKSEGCQVVCKKPEGVKFFVADTVAIVTWLAPNATKFVFQYKGETETTWKSINVTNSYYLLTGLARCKKYNVRIQAVCSSTSSSDYSSPITLETWGCQVECATPKAVGARIFDSTNAVLSWTNVGARAYIVEMKNISDPTGSDYRTDTVLNTILTVKNLKPCSKYVFRVRAVCGSRMTEPSELFTFGTEGCTPTLCEKPTNLKSEILADSVAILAWASNAAKFEIKYRIVGDSLWKYITSEAPQAKVYLRPCKVYEWRVKGYCSNSESDWSEPAKFETRGCANICEIPRDMKLDIVEDSLAIMYWTGNQGNYEIQYRLVNLIDSTENWTSVKVGSAGHKLSLQRCKVYLWRVRKICDNNMVSEWSEIGKFETRGCLNICPVPTGMNVRILNDTIAAVSWLGTGTTTAAYEIVYSNDGVNWQSVKTNTFGYELKLNRCKAYYWKVRKICGDNAISDWSAIGKFETGGCINPPTCVIPTLKVNLASDSVMEVNWAGQALKFELQYRPTTSSVTEWRSETFVGNTFNTKLALRACQIYEFRIRAICNDSLVSDWSPSIKAETKGCVIANPCAMPTGLGAEIAQDTSAFLYWTGSIVKYDLQYRIKGTDAWTNIALSSAGYKLAGLRRCTEYEWRIRRYCTINTVATASDWTPIQVFATKGCVNNCLSPANFTVRVDGTVAYANWSDMFERDSVFVEYKLSTDSAWTNSVLVGTSPNGVIIRGLLPCKKYIVKAYRKCADGSRSNLVEQAIATTGTGCFVNNGSTNRVSQSITAATIYPNPGRDYVQVEYTLENQADITVQMVNLQGQVVKQLTAGTQEQGNYMQVLDNISELNTGLYFIVIRSNGQVSMTQKWMKQ